MPAPTKQKFFLLLISLLGGAALVFGAREVFKNFYTPYPKIAGKNSQPINSELENFYQNYSAIIALQNKDTDADGLSDYDELYIYNTSPYLSDTDADGLDDKAELAGGSDPLCASGQNCELAISKNSGDEVLKNLTGSLDVSLNPEIYKENSDLQFLDQAIPDTAVANSGDLGTTSDLELTLENILSSPESLRKFLLTNGMKQEDLDKLSDQELLLAVEEAMGE